MQFMLHLDIPPLPQPITYRDQILLMGSCFTEHIAERLAQFKFRTLSNPHGILFNPMSVAASLEGYVAGKTYDANDLFLLNDTWNSWDHHTRFSNTAQDAALARINDSQKNASAFIAKADWVLLTLGSAFQYYLKETGRPVSNNHRAPAQWFERRLLTAEEIAAALRYALGKLRAANPFARVLFTISPVRHIREGIIDNNRSKARLIEAVHELCHELDYAFYFPAYELLIDVLRDYRFYDQDLVHPNYMGTGYVWERFAEACIDPELKEVMQQVQEITTARGHRSRFPDTPSHRRFLESYAAKTSALMARYPYLDLTAELGYFAGPASGS